MAVDWAEVTAEDIKASQPNALATGPFGSSIGSRFFQDYGIPVIRGSNLSEDVGVRLVHEDIVFISKEKAKEFERSIVRRGDLIFTCWGTIGQVGLIDDRCLEPEYVISNKQMKITPDPNKADSLFLYYLFSGPEMSERIRNQAIGSSVPGFNLGQLRSLRFQLPPLLEQRAIARILGALDDKIELNRRMNHTLEEMARAIFKSWFVDFDPVTAKSEDRQPYGMNAKTAALFPSAFQDSELGPIPRGWQVGTIADLAQVTSGKRPGTRSKSQTPDLRVPLFGGAGIMGYVSVPLYTEPVLLTGRVGTLGLVFRISEPCWPSDNTLILISKDICHYEYIYYSLQEIEFQSLNRGSTQPLVTQGDLQSQSVVLASIEIAKAFHSIAHKLFAKIDQNEAESRTLAAIRDALLPKLLSGEIRVNQVAETQ
jgi:type I restriction enzyme S subunit